MINYFYYYEIKGVYNVPFKTKLFLTYSIKKMQENSFWNSSVSFATNSFGVYLK